MKVLSLPIDPSASSISRLAIAKRFQFLPSVISSLFGFRSLKSDMTHSGFLNPSTPMTTRPFIYATHIAHRAKLTTGRDGALRRPRRPLKRSKATAVLLSVIGLTAFASSGFTQNVIVNPGAGSYPTLKGAFDAINAGTHTGALTVSIINDTNETASAVLNASGSGASSYTSIVINSSGTRTVSGTIAGHLIDLNGAQNVTIDGNTGGNSLTIDNTSNTAATSTIRFRADASNDVVTNCTIKGAGPGITMGTVFFQVWTT